MLLLCVVHADLEDGRPLVAQQGDGAAGRVQLVDAAAPVLVPEQEVLVVAQAKGMVELLAFVHRLASLRGREQNGRRRSDSSSSAQTECVVVVVV